jgi:uncharacterized protein involved in outer membrane biogenesis
MNVSGIFKILIIVVACIIVGGILLNVLLPNGLNGIVGWMEDGVHAATGANFDLNGDGDIGTPTPQQDAAGSGADGANVTGYNGGGFQ